MSALIITENYLKEYSNINKNVDMAILTPALYEVQTEKILPLLGTRLYNEIITQITAASVSALNQTLLDLYVIPCMINYAKAEALPDLKYRLMNKGVMIKNSENSSAADLSEIQWLMDIQKNKAELKAERVTKYLVQNLTSYPLYSANSNLDEIQPNKTNFTSGIWVGDDEDDCDCKSRYYR